MRLLLHVLHWPYGVTKISLTLSEGAYNLFVMSERRSDNRYKADPNQSLAKGLAVLEQLELAESEVGVRELARRVGVSTTAAHRLLATLRTHGFIEQNPYNLRYRIGHRAFQVGQSYLAQQTLQQIAFGRMHELSLHGGVAAYLGVLRNNTVVYLLSLMNGPTPVNVQPGSSAFVHSTALGKAMLAGLELDAREHAIAELELPALTPTTIVDRGRLREEIGRVAEDGFAICNTENIPSVYAIGAPIRDYTGQTVAAVSFAVMQPDAERHYAAEHERLRGMALCAAADISSQLGAVPYHAGLRAPSPSMM